MPSVRIPKTENAGYYYLTLTIKNWYYIFDRHNRWEILSSSLKYCQKHKNLKVYSYAFMLNHIHLIISSSDTAGFIRDFKRHTSVKLRENITRTEPNILKLFINKVGKYEFWAKTNMPKMITSVEFLSQKMNYIHNNPVKKRYVQDSEYWYWSSANPDGEIPLDKIDV